MIITPTSEQKLKGVHPDLVRVVRRLAKDWTDEQFSWIITCGRRSLDEQKLMVAKGASRTMRSRHIPGANGFAHAVDFACMLKINDKWVPRWDWPLYVKLAKYVKAAAKAEKVPIEWGGDWTGGFKDGPHFQLPWKEYPGNK